MSIRVPSIRTPRRMHAMERYRRRALAMALLFDDEVPTGVEEATALGVGTTALGVGTTALGLEP